MTFHRVRSGKDVLAKYAHVEFIDYTMDGHLMAEVQLTFTRNVDIGCVWMCSDTASAVIDVAGALRMASEPMRMS
jgi:hypothetical protein